jgi:hypothetical protein
MKSIKLNKKIQENTRFSMTLHKDATSQLLQVWKIGLHTWEKYVQDHHAQTPWCMSQPALANWSHELLLFVNAIQKHAGLGRPFTFTTQISLNGNMSVDGKSQQWLKALAFYTCHLHLFWVKAEERVPKRKCSKICAEIVCTWVHKNNTK